MKTNMDVLRLKRVLLNDNLRIQSGVADMLKNDIREVLESYFVMKEDALKLGITITEEGVYKIEIEGEAVSCRKMKSFSSIKTD